MSAETHPPVRYGGAGKALPVQDPAVLNDGQDRMARNSVVRSTKRSYVIGGASRFGATQRRGGATRSGTVGDQGRPGQVIA